MGQLEVEDFSSFNMNKTKIWAVLDCSFRTEDGGVTIIDWKTGRSMSEYLLEILNHGFLQQDVMVFSL